MRNPLPTFSVCWVTHACTFSLLRQTSCSYHFSHAAALQHLSFGIMIFTLVDMTVRCSELDGTSLGGHPLASLSAQALATALTSVARVLRPLLVFKWRAAKCFRLIPFALFVNKMGCTLSGQNRSPSIMCWAECKSPTSCSNSWGLAGECSLLISTTTAYHLSW